MPKLCQVATSVADLRREPQDSDWNNCKDRLEESQLLFGESVALIEENADWSRVEVPGQLTWRDGSWTPYPGWIRSEQLMPQQARIGSRFWVTAKKATLNSGRHLSWGTAIYGHVDGQSVVTAEGPLPLSCVSEQPPSLLELAQPLLGLRYYWGGRSSSGIDCSGLTQLLYLMHGKQLPRNASDQKRVCDELRLHAAQAGDLIFREEKNFIDHVMLYIGEGSVLEATEATGMVQIESLEKIIRVRGGRYSAGRVR